METIYDTPWTRPPHPLSRMSPSKMNPRRWNHERRPWTTSVKGFPSVIRPQSGPPEGHGHHRKLHHMQREPWKPSPERPSETWTNQLAVSHAWELPLVTSPSVAPSGQESPRSGPRQRMGDAVYVTVRDADTSTSTPENGTFSLWGVVVVVSASRLWVFLQKNRGAASRRSGVRSTTFRSPPPGGPPPARSCPLGQSPPCGGGATGVFGTKTGA